MKSSLYRIIMTLANLHVYFIQSIAWEKQKKNINRNLLGPKQMTEAQIIHVIKNLVIFFI